MADLLTAAQMRAIEQAAIQSGAVTGLELMERAGRGVVEAIFETWPDLARANHRAVVLCGPGNNGGDGFVIARLLSDWGWQVELFLLGDPDRLPPDAKANHARWQGRTLDVADYATRDCDLMVDACFGTGLARPITDDGARAFLKDCALAEASHEARRAGAAVHGAPPRTVAVDIPSGLCADSGRVLGGEHPWQDSPNCGRFGLTVTFHGAKPGHYLASGPYLCGKLAIKDIGIPLSPVLQRAALMKASAPDGAGRRAASLLGPRAAQPVLTKGQEAHKYDHGHALVLSGPMGRSGAARLAARAALRVGAGLVTVAAPGSAMMECACQLTAVMLRRADDAEGLLSLLEDPRMNALCLGPGLGLGQDTRALVLAALSRRRAIVLDADALTSFADAPEDLFQALHPLAVLTPHMGEFARLFPDLAQGLSDLPRKGPAPSRLDAARSAAARAGCTVLLKGPDTVIADQTGTASVSSAAYDRAAPWLATAGSGDVLAGIITGLLARGFAPREAAGAAAWLHTEAARRIGPGLIAEDLPDSLPQVLSRLAAES